MPTSPQPPIPGNGIETAADGVSFEVKPSSDGTIAVDASGVRVDKVSTPQVTDIDPNVGAMNLAGWV